MRVPDATLDEVREHGFSLVEGFLGPDELAAAQDALWLHFPRPQDYFDDPARFDRFAASQFAGVEEFPYRSWDLNRLAVHPDLVDVAERYLRTTELHLYKVELWAKYAGAIDYDQPLHRDYGSHSLVVPRPEQRYQQLTTFIYLSDVTELRRADPDRPLRERQRPVHAAVPAVRFAGRRRSALHRSGGDPPRLPDRHPASRLEHHRRGRSRFSILADFQVRGTTWGGKMAWPKQSPERWAKFLPQCSVAQRDLFGFPRPGDPYWTEETLEGVAARYPGIDLGPYRERLVQHHPRRHDVQLDIMGVADDPRDEVERTCQHR